MILPGPPPSHLQASLLSICHSLALSLGGPLNPHSHYLAIHQTLISIQKQVKAATPIRMGGSRTVVQHLLCLYAHKETLHNQLWVSMMSKQPFKGSFVDDCSLTDQA